MKNFLTKVRANIAADILAIQALMLNLSIARADTKLDSGSDVFDVGESYASEIYNGIQDISTWVCGAGIVVGVLVGMFGGSDKSADGGRKTVFTCIIAWVIINGIGFIFNFLENVLGESGYLQG